MARGTRSGETGAARKNPPQLLRERFRANGRNARGLVRFAVAPPPPKGLRPEPYTAQLALGRVHSQLVPLTREGDGYAIDLANSQDWFELPAGRGLAGYGLARALRILLDVLGGLSALHDTRSDNGRPFVHGELVPALVRVDASGTARLIPLAPWHSSTLGKQPSRERIGHLAPERLLGDAIDQRADVFSAGVFLWEALAGRRLFEANSVDEIIMRLMGGRVTLPALPPELSWALPLKDVVLCALAVDPEQRFANAADLAEAIEAVAAEHVASHAEVAAYFGAHDPHARSSVIEQPRKPTHNSSLSALVSPVTRPESAPASSPVTSRESSAPSSRRHGRLWAGAAGLLLLVALGVGLASRGSARAPEGAGSAPAPATPISAALRVGEPPNAAPSTAPTEPHASPTPSAPEAPAASTGTTSSGPGKSSKPSKGSKSLAPTLRAPAKAPAIRDKEAEKYGI